MTSTSITALTALRVDADTIGDLTYLEVGGIRFRGEDEIHADVEGWTGPAITAAPVVDTAALVEALTIIVATVDAEEGLQAAGLTEDSVNGFTYLVDPVTQESREYTSADLESDLEDHRARVALIRSLIASLSTTL